ncbi:MAG: pyruvate dehydrogenase complex dihydrolipoamide acetyltransferase [Labilithrix sp.]|nr:pyruvate dehydrogenase complex dihydrolipoamide acetyltransferase [Labilithrix sp.]
MAKILDMPKLSPTMEEGVLQTWHKNEGDAINVDDLLAEVETDKATMEFRAFDKGTLLKILVPAGTNVKLGQAVAILGNPGEDVAALVAEAGGGAPKKEAPKEEAPKEEAPKKEAPKKEEAPREARATKDTMPPAPRAQPAHGAVVKNLLTRTEVIPEPSEVGATTNGRVLASPYVRRIARERGIDLASAQGTGEHGRIVPADLEAIGASAPSTQRDGGGRDATALARPSGGLATVSLAEPEVRPLSPMRKTIARRLSQSKQTVPHFYLTIDVDAEALVELREGINAELAGGERKNGAPEGDKPLKVSLNDLIIKAVAAALVRVPECNAQFADDVILVHKRVDISVAVAIPDGLVTPVLRNADQKSVVAIAREVRDLAARARAKKLKPEEMSDGTFSISNLGMFGIDEFSAVINPPEGAILAVGQARSEPVVKDGVVKPGKKMGMTLSCDHRVIDGAVGAAFLAELRALIEHPMRILTG